MLWSMDFYIEVHVWREASAEKTEGPWFDSHAKLSFNICNLELEQSEPVWVLWQRIIKWIRNAHLNHVLSVCKKSIKKSLNAWHGRKSCTEQQSRSTDRHPCHLINPTSRLINFQLISTPLKRISGQMDWHPDYWVKQKTHSNMA